MTREYADAVHAWATELRAGSTRTWEEFRASPGDPGSSPEPEAILPGAGQLEVVRRLAQLEEVPDFAGLADLVLATPGPGRGRLDVPLPWDEQPAFGSPPVAPEELSPDELLRVVGGALTRLLVELPVPAPARDRHLPRPFAKRASLLGAPTSARIVGEALTGRGVRLGGPKSTFVVLAGPLDKVMAQRWAARVRAGSTIRWRRFWRYAHTNDRIPPGIQAPLLAERLAREVGGRRVHVVIGEDTATIAGTVGDILGVALPPVEEPAEQLATDLLRVVNAPLTLAVGGERREEIATRLWPGLAGGEPYRGLGVPREHLDWALEMGARQVQRIEEGAARAGYAVHGDPSIVVPDPARRAPRAVRRESTLALGLEVLTRAWWRSIEGRLEDGPREGREG